MKPSAGELQSPAAKPDRVNGQGTGIRSMAQPAMSAPIPALRLVIHHKLETDMSTIPLSPIDVRATLKQAFSDGVMPKSAICFRERDDHRAITAWDEDGRQLLSLLVPYMPNA